MTEIARHSGCSDWIKLDFVEWERTPIKLMKLSIWLHLTELSLSNTIREREKFGATVAERGLRLGAKSRSTASRWCESGSRCAWFTVSATTISIVLLLINRYQFYRTKEDIIDNNTGLSPRRNSFVMPMGYYLLMERQVTTASHARTRLQRPRSNRN